ncbi:MAG TPA: hypothetical protein VGJ19_18215 [Streptosporangiaceae bacterium]
MVAGIGFTLSWLAGLAQPVPNLALNAPATEIIGKFGPHLAAVQAQFALTEGLPALGLAVVALALARAARRPGSAAGAGTGRARARIIAVAGTVAALISAAQYALGVTLAGWAIPDHAAGQASALWQAVNRLDGVKMFALAVLAAAALALAAPAGSGAVLPRWLRYASLLLAATITVSGVAYLFLIQDLAFMAYVAGPALLVWVTGVGLALGRIPRRASR